MNVTALGYDIYVYGVRFPQGVSRVQFPTWTVYGGQDDLQSDWDTNTKYSGINLGNGTWKYHVDISDHNNEAGKYITHVYILDSNNKSYCIIATASAFIETTDYVGSLYLDNNESTFDGTKLYQLGSKVLNTNFTYDFDAQPSVSISLFKNGEYASAGSNNIIIREDYSNEENIARIGLSLGINGAVAIAHAPNYYYVLLSYQADLSDKHRYRFTIRNNIPELYIDGILVATGIAPLSPITTLYTRTYIGWGSYGGYLGYANNFVLYNSAR